MTDAYQLSPHFWLREFHCKDGTHVPVELLGNVEELAREVLERIRETWGGPLTVVSGYRTASYQAHLGGVPGSAHILGMAADIAPADPDSAPALWSMIRHMYAEGKLPKLGGLGRYPHWVHVDTRKLIAHLRQWDGGGVGSEPA